MMNSWGNPFMMNPMMMGNPFAMMMARPVNIFMQTPKKEEKEETEKTLLQRMLMENSEMNESLKSLKMGQVTLAPSGGG